MLKLEKAVSMNDSMTHKYFTCFIHVSLLDDSAFLSKSLE